MRRSKLWSLVLVAAALFLMRGTAFVQQSGQDSSTGDDLVVMQEGTRMKGTILKQSSDRIVYEMNDPTSIVGIPLEDIYSINGLSVRRFERMRSYLRTTNERIETVMPGSFSTAPRLRVASQKEFNRQTFPLAQFPSIGSAPSEFVLYRELGVMEGGPTSQQDFESSMEGVKGPIQVHPERSELLVLPRSSAVTGTSPEGTLPYLDRFRLAHLAAHLFLRQNDDQPGVPSVRDRGSTDRVLASTSLREGKANYIALLCVQRESGYTGNEPLPLQALVDSATHFSKARVNGLPRLMRNRLRRVVENGLKRIWLTVHLGGLEALLERRKGGPPSTLESARLSDYFSGKFSSTSFVPGSNRESGLSGWTKTYEGALGYRVLSRFVRRITPDGEGKNSSRTSGYRTDRFYSLSAQGGEQQMLGWVVHWKSQKRAETFYERTRTYLENRPWSLEPGWRGGKHQFYQRSGRRISIDHEGKRVFLLMAPSASAHNQLMDRMNALQVETKSVSPAVSATRKEFREAKRRFDAATQPWSPSEYENVTVKEDEGTLVCTNPYLMVNRPSFWSFETSSKSARKDRVLLTPREGSSARIRVRFLTLSRPLKNSFVSLIRSRSLDQNRDVSSLRHVRGFGEELRIRSDDEKQVDVVDVFQYQKMTDGGEENNVFEVLVRHEKTVFLFQLFAPDVPGTVQIQMFQEFINNASFRKDTSEKR